MKKLFLALALILALGSVACTQQDMARNFGGTAQIDLPPGEKLVNVTWKQVDLWILTRPANPGETPQTYRFKESSSFGVMEGTVVIQEHR